MTAPTRFIAPGTDEDMVALLRVYEAIDNEDPEVERLLRVGANLVRWYRAEHPVGKPGIEDRLAALVKNAGTPGECRSCHAGIFWIHHPGTGRNAPYDADGVNHFITCPNRDAHRRA